MAKTIYVGNLSFSTTEDQIRELFAQHGTVHSVRLATDRQTGRPRGFGFVEMDPDAAQAAIEALDGVELGGRNLRVNEAKEKTERRPGGNRRRDDYGPKRPW
jgi:RNA recognition motif-containing protein